MYVGLHVCMRDRRSRHTIECGNFIWWLYVSGQDVLRQSPRHNICAFIELSCYLNCFIKIACIMLNIYSDSDSELLHFKYTTEHHTYMASIYN